MPQASESLRNRPENPNKMYCERTDCDRDSGGGGGCASGVSCSTGWGRFRDDSSTGSGASCSTGWGRSRDESIPVSGASCFTGWGRSRDDSSSGSGASCSTGWGRSRDYSSPDRALHVLAMCYRHLLQFLSLKLHSFFGRTARRRRSLSSGACSHLATFLVFSALAAFTEACSSRNTPKPRPPPPSARPNVTFPTYTCPPAYAAWYCLNGATCFTIKIEDSLLYNCECAEGYMGQRCEFKDLDGSYLPSRQRVLLETASIAGGATIAVFLVVIVCATLYLHYQRKAKQRRIAGMDRTDGVYSPRSPRPFSRSLSIPMERLDERHKELSVKAKSQLCGLKTDSTAYRAPP